MNNSYYSENELLRCSWQRHDTETLDRYLVSGVEDPRINVQSILTRALLCDLLFPGRYSHLIDEELRFGYVMTWLATQLDRGVEKCSLLTAIKENRSELCPGFIVDSFRRVQENDCSHIDYITTALDDRSAESGLLPESLDAFQRIWHSELGNASHGGYLLFEPACGSANDYRFLSSFGFARFVRYTGIDIAPKNIDNARRRFPDIDFRIGDLLNNDMPDDSFDFSFVHDLFEHLSLEAMHRAVEELLRMTRREVWFHFFNAANMSSHQVRSVGAYHWNCLSIGKMISLVEQSASQVHVIPIVELARNKFDFQDYYNPGAYTIIASR